MGLFIMSKLSTNPNPGIISLPFGTDGCGVGEVFCVVSFDVVGCGWDDVVADDDASVFGGGAGGGGGGASAMPAGDSVFITGGGSGAGGGGGCGNIGLTGDVGFVGLLTLFSHEFAVSIHCPATGCP